MPAKHWFNQVQEWAGQDSCVLQPALACERQHPMATTSSFARRLRPPGPRDLFKRKKADAEAKRHKYVCVA
jgi:hypothetical protein